MITATFKITVPMTTVEYTRAVRALMEILPENAQSVLKHKKWNIDLVESMYNSRSFDNLCILELETAITEKENIMLALLGVDITARSLTF